MDAPPRVPDPNAYPAEAPWPRRLRFLLGYAILAPSSHNTQPWRFQIDRNRVRVFQTERGWLPIADPDRRELRLGVGCAIENLLVAAQRFGLFGRVDRFPDPEDEDLVAEIEFSSDGSASIRRPPELFEAIGVRRTTRRPFEDRSLPEAHADRLRALATESHVAVHLTDDPELRAAFTHLVRRADAIQGADSAWRDELGAWISRGVFGTGRLASSIGGFLIPRIDPSRWTGPRDARLLRRSSSLGIVTTRRSGRAVQVEAGQAFERIWLGATALGLCLHPMSQVLQLPGVRSELVGLLPSSWGHPQVTFRTGYGEPDGRTPRRSVDEVIL